MMWKASKWLGCALSGNSCASGLSPFYACHYANSAPNYAGQYLDNVPQSNTPVKSEAECCNLVYGTASILPIFEPTTPTPAPTPELIDESVGTTKPPIVASAASSLSPTGVPAQYSDAALLNSFGRAMVMQFFLMAFAITMQNVMF